MPVYRCRHLLPEPILWREVEATDWIDAAQAYHLKCTPDDSTLIYSGEDSDGRKCSFSFALIEVEGERTTISRTMHYGIGRRGGIRSPATFPERLVSIAKRLGWTEDPIKLLEQPWAGEESLEEAQKRQDAADRAYNNRV